jgi:hypothetical protein
MALATDDAEGSGQTSRGVESYLQYVEHPEARKHRWVRCICGRSWKLVRNAG